MIQIIGTGQIATAFHNLHIEKDILVFASGASDSKTESLEEFTREKELLIHSIHKYPGFALLYFSTASIYDESLNNSAYCRHKIDIEKTISSLTNNFYIIRTSNIVSKSGNPLTIFNYLKNKIKNQEKFELWSNAERNLLDLDDLVKFSYYIIQHHKPGIIFNFVNPNSIKVASLVEMIGNRLGVKPHFISLNKGLPLNYTSNFIIDDFNEMGIDFKDYYSKLLDKYL